MKQLFALLSPLALVACASLPKGIEGVSNFELQPYLGTWYEIARLDHSFERNLEQVTATYNFNDNGSVAVLNRGFSTKSNKWKEAKAKARFVGEKNIGHLEVSFFGPFYSDYVIFELDQDNYQYAFVTGSENSLWFLSRTPTVSEALKNRFLSEAEKFGFAVDELIFVEHTEQ